MKKLAVILVALGLMSFLAGCGTDMSDSIYTGYWEARSYDYDVSDGQGYRCAYSAKQMDETNFELNSKGKVEGFILGDEISGKWSETEDGVLFGETVLKEKDDYLVLVKDGLEVVFQRAGSESIPDGFFTLSGKTWRHADGSRATDIRKPEPEEIQGEIKAIILDAFN